MMDFDSRERGYPIEATSGVEGIYLYCRACKHTVRMRWADVVATWAVGTYTRDIARSLKCSKCGARQGSIQSWVDSRPRHARHLPDTEPYPIIGPVIRS